MDNARREAEHFVKFEREFHLGVLPTEQSHPRTRGLAEVIAKDTRKGIQMLQSVDDDVVVAARRVFASGEFQHLVEALRDALDRGNRICFSGCGATGRLSILLEAAYRAFWDRTRTAGGTDAVGEVAGRVENAVSSIMTGGDYALIRSVEFYEDYETFGRQQLIESGLGRGDVLVAITEGGETSSVIGTIWQALEAGADVFLACNNPLDILAAHVERSRRVIEDTRITKLDLSSGPMAIAGSTRMQATTAELLVIGAALEIALVRYLKSTLPCRAFEALGLDGVSDDYAARFREVLQSLSQPAAVDTMARWAEFEESLYRDRNAITYFGNDFLLDIFTDTTERAPTFSLHPFRKCDDVSSPRPPAFVKNPLHPTDETWRRMLGRKPRCLTWSPDEYRNMGAEESIWRNPPILNRKELFKFLIGHEDDPSRYEGTRDCAALVVAEEESADCGPDSALGAAFAAASSRFPSRAVIAIGPSAPPSGSDGTVFHIPCQLPPSPLRLWDRLALKLALNTVSTATATRMGRVVSNWMAHVETSNKKLIDRGTRLVSELAGLDYAEACFELHKTREQLSRSPKTTGERVSPVALTLERLRQEKDGHR